MDDLQILGDVRPGGRQRWTHADLDSAPTGARVDDISKVLPGRRGRGVLLRWLIEQSCPGEAARWACLESADGSFAASLEVDDLEGAVVVHADEQGPLGQDRGGPFRLLIPGAADACGNIKHLGRVTLGAAPERDTRPPESERNC